MPIIQSAKKRARQAVVRQARNYNVRSALRKALRAVADAVRTGKTSEAQKLSATAYKMIDTATKKNILHKNTAARRKSLLARQISATAKKKD